MDILSLFQTNGFLINVAITLLLVGVVVYYFRNKIKHLENSQIEQAKVLQSFIRKMSLENGGLTEESSNSNQLTNDTVVNSANLYIDNEKTDKIDVSDDSESDSESESDSDSDADEETEQIVNKVLKDTDVKKITINETTEDDLNNDVDSKQVEETVLLNVSKVSDMTEEVSNEMMDKESESDSSSDSDSDSDSDSEHVQELEDKDSENKTMESETSKEEVQEKNGETENVDDNTDVNSDEVVEKNNIKSETLQYSRMKVNALRDLAVENNLIENDAAKKKKKKELVELLEASSTM